MPQPSFRIPHPRGLLRWLMRAPILLYRLHLGGLMGGRFLLLEHRGRKSGALRQAVIEVVDHDPADGSYVVAAAWGMKSDWYRNIAADSNVIVTVRSHRFPALARTLSKDEARTHLQIYARRNPSAFKNLGSLLTGEGSHETEAMIQRFVDSIPFVEFAPKP